MANWAAITGVVLVALSSLARAQTVSDPVGTLELRQPADTGSSRTLPSTANAPLIKLPDTSLGGASDSSCRYVNCDASGHPAGADGPPGKPQVDETFLASKDFEQLTAPKGRVKRFSAGDQAKGVGEAAALGAAIQLGTQALLGGSSGD